MVDNYVIFELLKADPETRFGALRTLEWVAALPSSEARLIWNATLPPFEQPEEQNIFSIFRDMIQKRGIADLQVPPE